jgi:uncharacterized protein YjbI with pentapeptide repeats
VFSVVFFRPMVATIVSIICHECDGGGIMANAEQERLLRENVNDWNNWRKNFFEIPDLSDAVFHKLDLTTANLSHVNLQGAEFYDCLLSSASFESAQLQNAKFGSIKCSDQVNFLYAKMCRSRMTNCKWRNSSFNNANLANAVIEESHFRTCKFVLPS